MGMNGPPPKSLRPIKPSVMSPKASDTEVIYPSLYSQNSEQAVSQENKSSSDGGLATFVAGCFIGSLFFD